MTLRRIVHGGVTVSISHLAPVLFPCPCAAIRRDLVIRAIFSNHCYTKGFNPEQHSREQIVLYDSGNRPRVFCPVRHELSLQLPTVVCGLPNKSVHQTPERRNYVYTMPLEFEGRSYDVFFMLQRETRDGIDLRLTVESAYLKSGALILPKKPGKIRFTVLALRVFQGKPVQFLGR